MRPGLAEAGFFALALAVLVLAAFLVITDGSSEDPVAMARSVADITQPALSPPSSSPPTVARTVLGPSETTTTTLRELTVEVMPDEAEVEVAIEADGEQIAVGSAPLSASVPAVVTVTVEGDGYRREVIAPEPTSDTVAAWLDPPDQIVDRRLEFTTGDAPKQVAFTPDGSELWVTLLGGTGLEAYSPSTGELVAAIDLPEAGSVEVIFDRVGDTAFVSQMETASVYEIDVASHRVLRQFQTGGTWTKVMLLTPDEKFLWASNWVSNDVSEIDLATGEVVRRLPTVVTPRGLALSPDGSTLFVAGYDAGEIAAIDLGTGTTEVLHRSGGAMRHLVADPAAGVIYASDMATDEILVVDSSTGEVRVLAEGDRLPNTIDVSPDGSVLAVSHRGRNNPETYYLPGPEWGSVLLFDTATGEILDAIVGGNQPTGLDISADGEWLAFSDFLDDRVTVFALPDTPTLRAGGGGRADSYRTELAK